MHTIKEPKIKNVNKILIVDDAKDSLKLFQLFLRNYETYIENDSRQAIGSFSMIKPEVVVLDYRMPYIDGGDIAAEIKCIDKNCKVIMVSTLVKEDVNLQNADLFLRKPVAAETLCQAVEELLKS